MRRILSPKLEGSNLVRVKELMNSDGSGWNQNLLSQLFSLDEISIIKKNPFSSMDIADRLMWNATKNGQYTVRDSYKLAKFCKVLSTGEKELLIGESRKSKHCVMEYRI